MNEELLNKVGEELLKEVNEWEEEGLDEDEIEVQIDEWFEEFNTLVKSRI